MELKHPNIPKSRPLAMLIVALVIALIGWIDFQTGAELSVSILYLVPIAFATWILGQWWGVAAAVACAGIGTFSDFLLGPSVYSMPWIAWWNGGIKLAVYVVVVVVLAALRGALDREHRASHQDFTTGLGNWRAFSETAEAELARVRRFGRPVTLVYMDADHFKQVNDKFGHQAGDDLLRRIAESVALTVREIDTVSRLGGDEFVVLLPETDSEQAERALERMRAGLTTTLAANGTRGVTMSFGAVTYVNPPASVDEMLAAADRLLYRAKELGRDTVVHEVM